MSEWHIAITLTAYEKGNIFHVHFLNGNVPMKQQTNSQQSSLLTKSYKNSSQCQPHPIWFLFPTFHSLSVSLCFGPVWKRICRGRKLCHSPSFITMNVQSFQSHVGEAAQWDEEAANMCIVKRVLVNSAITSSRPTLKWSTLCTSKLFSSAFLCDPKTNGIITAMNIYWDGRPAVICPFNTVKSRLQMKQVCRLHEPSKASDVQKSLKSIPHSHVTSLSKY